MNMNNLAAQIAEAEACGNAQLLADIARQLLERPSAPPTTRKRKATAGHDAAEFWTRTERLAAGLAPIKDGKISGGKYRWVLVEFENGVRMVTGQYPRVKEPESLAPSIISARARYLGILSGRVLDAAHAHNVPQVINARVLTEVEAEMERRPCMRQRAALEAFAPIAKVEGGQ
jgi:hypothetical protein